MKMKLIRNAANAPEVRGKVCMTICGDSSDVIDDMILAMREVSNGFWRKAESEYQEETVNGVEYFYYVNSHHLKDFKQDYKEAKALVKKWDVDGYDDESEPHDHMR